MNVGGLNVFLRYTFDNAEPQPWVNWYQTYMSPETSAAFRDAFSRGAEPWQLWPLLEVEQSDLIVEIDAMERWRGALLIPWQTSFGQALLLAAAIVHAALGLASLASRHSLAMSRTDWVQLLLGLASPPLLLNHVVGLQVTSDLVARFRADYGYVLAVYWHYAPLFALQQLLVVVIVWAHGAIGLYSTLVSQRAWP